MSLQRMDGEGQVPRGKPKRVADVDHSLPAETAFERHLAEAYERLYPELIRAVRRGFRSMQESPEDVVHTVFAKYLEAYRNGELTERGDGFFWQSVRNLAVTVWNRENVFSFEELPDDDSVDAIRVVDASMTSGASELLWLIVDQLPERCRQVYVLARLFHGTREQVAADLGVTLETVKTHLRRAAVLIPAVVERSNLTLDTFREAIALDAGMEDAHNA